MNKTIIAIVGAFCMLLQSVGISSASPAKGDVYTHTVGSIEVTTLLDAVFGASEEWLLDAGSQKAGVAVTTGATKGYLNLFVIKVGGKTVLFDTGFGGASLSGGALVGSGLAGALASAGIAADDIDAVVLSHYHEDHVGGLLHEGKPTFPRAEIFMSEVELASYGEKPELHFVAVYGARCKAFAAGAEILFRVFSP